MKEFVERHFQLRARGSNLKTEIIGGLLTFIAMSYILPLNASILSAMGMNQVGVFVITGLLSFLTTWIMGIVANYPIALSAGMGLNAFLAFTLSSKIFPTWQQRMILLTIAGIAFFVFSLSPIRKAIIDVIPKSIKGIISAALGAFIAFVGLKGTGLIAGDSSTLVTIGNFVDPAVFIGFVSIIITIGLHFSKRKLLSTLSVPVGIAFAAIFGLIVSSSLISTGHIEQVSGVWRYNFSSLDGLECVLPIFPTYDSSLTFGMNASSVSEVFLYGVFSGYDNFGNDLVYVLSTPASYIAIFSLIFVNIFDTTATLVSVGSKVGIIDVNGQMDNYRKAIFADAFGALVCAPLGTSTTTSFAESNVGVSFGARTGIASIVTGFLFLLSVFLYPIFSVFTAGSVTSCALVVVGVSIVLSAFEGIDMKDPLIAFDAVFSVIFATLTYSITNGIGMAFLIYVISLLFSHRVKEIRPGMVILAVLFLFSFFANAIMGLIAG